MFNRHFFQQFGTVNIKTRTKAVYMFVCLKQIYFKFISKYQLEYIKIEKNLSRIVCDFCLSDESRS